MINKNYYKDNSFFIERIVYYREELLINRIKNR